MQTVRNLRGKPAAHYPDVACQNTAPDGYCYCDDPTSGMTCPGRYDPFQKPSDAMSAGATDPYNCWVQVPDGAEPNLDDVGVASTLKDENFNGWYGAKMMGDECVNMLRINSCNRASIAQNGGTTDGMQCQERGDMRFKFLSYVDQPGTDFLGIATMRSDPVSGEIMAGDANIGGPALDGYRTYAMQQYDLIHGDLQLAGVLHR